MSEHDIEGTARDIGGKVESTVGNLTGDTKSKVDGKVDQVAGQAQKAYGNAKDAVSDAADQAKSKLGDAADQAKSKLGDVADQAQSKLSGVADQASQLGGQAYEQGAKAAKYVGDYVRNEPVAVMLGVAALGMLAGYLLGRPPHERAVELGRFRAAYRDR